MLNYGDTYLNYHLMGTFPVILAVKFTNPNTKNRILNSRVNVLIIQKIKNSTYEGYYVHMPFT